VLDQIPVEDEDFIKSAEAATDVGAPSEMATGPASQLKDITYNADAESATINLIANGSIENYKEFTLNNPKRLVVDIQGVKSKLKAKSNIVVKQGGVARIRTGAYPDKLRVVVELTKAAPNYQINKASDGLTIAIGAASAGLAASSPATPKKDELQ